MNFNIWKQTVVNDFTTSQNLEGNVSRPFRGHEWDALFHLTVTYKNKKKLKSIAWAIYAFVVCI